MIQKYLYILEKQSQADKKLFLYKLRFKLKKIQRRIVQHKTYMHKHWKSESRDDSEIQN